VKPLASNGRALLLKIIIISLFSALQRERNLRAELRESLELERNNSLSKSQQTQSTINDLQSRLDFEKSKYLDIASALEREQKKVTTLNLALEGDRSQYLVDLEHERATCRQLKNNIDAIEVRVDIPWTIIYT
jgi:hypothetical protein